MNIGIESRTDGKRSPINPMLDSCNNGLQNRFSLNPSLNPPAEIVKGRTPIDFKKALEDLRAQRSDMSILNSLLTSNSKLN